MFIHNTAIVAFGFYFIYKYLYAKHYTIRLMLLLLASVAVMLSWRYIMNFALSHNILKQKYESYADYDGLAFSPVFTVFTLPMLALTVLYVKDISRSFRLYEVFWGMAMVGFIFAQLAGLYGPMGRIGLYYLYPQCFLFGSVVKRNRGLNKILAFTIILLYIVGYWTYYTVFNGYRYFRPVYPYFTCFQN